MEAQRDFKGKRTVMATFALLLLIAAGFSLVPLSEGAPSGVEVDGIIYDLNVPKNGEATVVSGEYQGEIMIPATVTSNSIEYNVTKIDESAFKNNSNVTLLIIGSKVKTIDKNAFQNCTELTTVTFDAASSLETIREYTFSGCTALDSITLPNSITTIGNNSFENCSNLKSITIPNSVNKINANAFTNCITLDTVLFGEHSLLKELPSEAFKNCSSLKSITIPNSVTSISRNVFENTGLISIVIPNSVETIGSQLFQNCKSLTEVVFEKTSSLKIISNEAFKDCSSLSSITIPDSVTDINRNAFLGCVELTDVLFETSKLKTIGISAFKGCSSLSSITIPDSVTTIGSDTFSGCSGLTSVEFGESPSLDKLETNLFYNCSLLASITIPDSVTVINNYAFYNCSNLKSIPIPDSVTTINKYAFASCSGLTSIIIPNSVTTIGDGVFTSCSNLSSITIPNSVTDFGTAVFNSCPIRTLTITHAKENPTSTILGTSFNWKLPGQNREVTDLVIDAFDLSILTIEGGTGRTIIFTENATETTGGSFYDPDGPELTGSERAVKKYTYDATTGKWLALKHTVSFNAKSDEPVPDGRVFDGGILTEPTEPADFSRYGYIFEGWFLDSGFNNAYDFSTPVTSDFTLYAKWSPAFLNTITSSAGFGGHIDPTDTQVPYDGVIFSFQANAGYRIKDVKVDGVSVDYDVDDDGVGSYTFRKVEESHTIHVEFEAYCVISVNNPGNGSITADDYEPSYGDDVTITIASNEGYTLDALTDNDVNVLASAVETDAGVWTYTISSVESDHDIFVAFTKITYEMTVDWSGEGSVSPDSDFVVEHGNNATFTFWTDEGHCICEVLADGISVDFNIDEDGRGTYTFLNITADHTFEVIFEIMTHNVVLVPGDGYTLVPAEGYSSPVDHKGSFAFVFSLKEGYSESVPVILMNGTEIATVSNGNTVSMILLNIIEDIEITVDGIVANVYTVTVKSDDKMSFVYVLNENDPVEFIAGPGESYHISVPHGSDLTVQAMPDEEELFQWHNTGTGTADGNILIINVTEDVTVSGALQKEPWTARLNTYEFKMAAAGVVLVVPLLIGIRRLRL